MHYNNKKTRTTLLGIDAGFDTMGAATWCNTSRSLDLFGGRFDQVLEWISNQDTDRMVAVIEDPRMDSAIFQGWEELQTLIEAWARVKPRAKKNAWAAIDKQYRSNLRIASNVGENRAAAKRTIQIFRNLRIPVVTIAPSQRKRVDDLTEAERRMPIQAWSMPTKTNKAQFKELTGWGGNSNEHARDAATLIFGRNINWANTLHATQNHGTFFQ